MIVLGAVLWRGSLLHLQLLQKREILLKLLKGVSVHHLSESYGVSIIHFGSGSKANIFTYITNKQRIEPALDIQNTVTVTVCSDHNLWPIFPISVKTSYPHIVWSPRIMYFLYCILYVFQEAGTLSQKGIGSMLHFSYWSYKLVSVTVNHHIRKLS